MQKGDGTSYFWAEDDIADASAEAEAWWTKDWTWNGPPEYAPGGSLAWTHNGNGDSYVSGHNEMEGGGHASCVSQASDIAKFTKRNEPAPKGIGAGRLM